MCMSAYEITERINAGELPAALSKEAWERKLKIVKDRHIRSYDDLLEHFDNNGIEYRCALCIIYFDNDNKCIDCPLCKIEARCDNDISAYSKLWDCELHDEFVNRIENMIKVLGEAVEFEIRENNEN